MVAAAATTAARWETCVSPRRRAAGGNAAANSGADQLAVVDAAIASLSESWRAGHRPGDEGDDVVYPILVRADTAGAVAAFIAGLVVRNISFSVGAG